MKNLFSIVVLLAIVFTFSACSDDDDSVDLSGKYISDQAGITEIYTLELTPEVGYWNQCDEGESVDYECFIYNVSGDSIQAFYQGEMLPHKFAYVIRGNEFIFHGITYRKVPSERYYSLAGHTYVAADWESSTHNLLYDIYEFYADGTYSVDIRRDSITGKQYGTNKGVYTQPDSSLCFALGNNEQPARVDSDYKSFYCRIYDQSIGRNRTLIFYAY